MIIKNVSGLDVLRWISKKWQGNKTIATASNKLNVYKLHTCNENYDLKNNLYINKKCKFINKKDL